MEELMKAIQEKTGLPAGQAQGAAQAAMDFLKEKLPAGIGDKLEISISDAVGGVTDNLKGLLGS